MTLTLTLTSSGEGHTLASYKWRVFRCIVDRGGEVVSGTVQQRHPSDDTRTSTPLKDNICPVNVYYISLTTVDVKVARDTPMTARVQLLCQQHMKLSK